MSLTYRHALIAGSVVLLHGAALWALQAGLLRRAYEVVVPVQVLEAAVLPPEVQEAAPAAPRPAPAPPPRQVQAPPPPAPQPAPPVPRRVQPAPAPAPAVRSEAPAAQPAARPEPAAAPAAAAPAPAAALPPPAAPAPAPAAALPPPAATAPAPAAPAAAAAAAQVDLPISDADYLHNPPPKWPRLSERLGERGRVLLRVLIGTDGRPKTAQVKESSGYRRLDEASVAAAMSWRYVPGKRGGVPEEMWVQVPIRWGE